MIEEQKGSPDGRRVEKYLKSKTYEMPEKLANIFISIDAAEPAKEEERMRKNAGDAPMNKVATPQAIPAPEVENNIDDLPKEKVGKKIKSKKDKPSRRSY
jgi:hypothetical protein